MDKNIVGLILNAVGLTGVGTLIIGEKKHGWIQVAILVIGTILFSIYGGVFFGEGGNLVLAIISYLLLLGNWIWGLVISVSAIRKRI